METIEELALPLQGKKRNLTRKIWVEYFGSERLSLPQKIIDRTLGELSQAVSVWHTRIEQSFLPPDHKELYLELLSERAATLSL